MKLEIKNWEFILKAEVWNPLEKIAFCKSLHVIFGKHECLPRGIYFNFSFLLFSVEIKFKECSNDESD